MGPAAYLLPVLSGLGFACATVLGWQGLRIVPGRDDHRGASICAAFLLLWMACASLVLAELADAVGRLEAGRGCPSPRKHQPGGSDHSDEVTI